MTTTDDDVIEKLNNTFQDASRLQIETLRCILERNGGVSYLQPYLGGYGAPVDAATFRRVVPISCYDDYADHIRKLSDGILLDDRGQSLLSVDPLICFFYSSGTSSMNAKLLPCFDSKPGRAASSLAHQATGAILRRFFLPKSSGTLKGTPSGNKVLGFLYAGKVTQTKGGLMAMAATAFPLHFNNQNASRFLSNYASPKEVILGTDFSQQTYCHLLCGLLHFDSINGIMAPYAAGLIKAFTVLESNWKLLCKDLENGFPSSEISDAAMRQAIVKILGGPQPELSNRTRRICEEKSFEGIVSKLWPNVCYVKCVTTGSMMQYYPRLKYYAGETPVLGSDYFSSECCVAMNLDITQPPELTHYVILPSAAYFEFIPFDTNFFCFGDEVTVELTGLEVGKMYELVVTTFRGLYRFRLGDIVRVVGFYHGSPQIEFVMRAPKSSGEIITEKDLLFAMGSFQVMVRDELATVITDFASFMELESELKQLEIFVEMNHPVLSNDDTLRESLGAVRKCCTVLEGNLGAVYHIMKERSEVGPLSVSFVRQGTFDWLLEEAIQNGAPASQYKPPKIIRNRKVANYMKKCAVLTLVSEPLI